MILGAKVILCLIPGLKEGSKSFNSKGSGKTSMIVDAMIENDAEGASMCTAHPNLEVFRQRLGRTLDFEFNEDSYSGLFQRRDPREGWC